MGMDQYLLIPFLGEWTSIYQLFWCSPGVQGFDTLPYLESTSSSPPFFPILLFHTPADLPVAGAHLAGQPRERTAERARAELRRRLCGGVPGKVRATPLGQLSGWPTDQWVMGNDQVEGWCWMNKEMESCHVMKCIFGGWIELDNQFCLVTVSTTLQWQLQYWL